MERKDEQQQPEQPQPMAQDKDKHEPDEQNEKMDNTVGKVPDPQDEDSERKES
jgi:hypothetical protein